MNTGFETKSGGAKVEDFWSSDVLNLKELDFKVDSSFTSWKSSLSTPIRNKGSNLTK